ncbi:hypothetical protein JAAARDRAFT_41279 [Jaapia argillacea MUCL 33604]|uniref:F-box domain-containing protein n=1 Tax=Jaapia argillacea MUCL 33604 TaxID=933084 RepID=A0A067P8I2_9AGAM|nr:hypothetical protein JAAARDRAFT_41279 [Jaapia argillacea MUCL 33604]
MTFTWGDIPLDVLQCIFEVTATIATVEGSCVNDPGNPHPGPTNTALALSMVDSGTRKISYPWVFEQASFCDSSTWVEFDERMKVTLKNPALCRAIRSFKIHRWFSEPDANRPTSMTYSLLPTLLSSLPRLHTLTFRIQDSFVPSFRSSFSAHGPLLTVSTLYISLGCTFLISHCPNIQDFECDELYQDEEVRVETWAEELGHCAGMRVLRPHLPIGSGMLRALLKHVPQLEEIYFNMGVIAWRAEPEDKENTEGIMKFLPSIASFTSLRILDLPTPSCLDIGFHPPRCGNAYFNNPGLVKRIARERGEAADRVAGAVEVMCPSVRELWVGSACYKKDGRGHMREVESKKDED